MSEGEPSYLGVPISKVGEIVGSFVSRHITITIVEERGPRTLIIPVEAVLEAGFSFDPAEQNDIDIEDLEDLLFNAINPFSELTHGLYPFSSAPAHFW